MRFDRSTWTYLALAVALAAFSVWLFLVLTRQDAPDNRSQADRLAFWQTVFSMFAIVISTVSLVVTAKAANDARTFAKESKEDAATDRKVADQRAVEQRAIGLQDAADDRMRVDRERKAELAQNEQRLIIQALRIAREVVASGDRYARVLDEGIQPDWASFDSPNAKATVATKALDALGSNGTTNPDLVYELALLRAVMENAHRSTLPPANHERSVALRADDAKIEKAIRRIEPFERPHRQ